MRCTAFIHPIVVLLAALLTAPEAATAQDIVVRVNGGPVTSYDVAQRMRWNNRTNNFGERMKARLIGDATGKEFRRRLMAAQPHNQAEAQQMAERIKKELVEDAKKQVLSEEDPATRKAMIEALIEDRLKLLEAKRLGIEIGDSEVEEALAARAGTGADGKPDLNAFYTQFENDGIGRKTIQELIRAQLAWRDAIRLVCRPGATEVFPHDCKTFTPSTYENFSRSYLQELRQKASIEYLG
jgi:peptidyl-prolyl cis-trans isomerase SurA